jgi:2,3-bisphosphoglycerate-dependent phosphoglycerate mutase
LDRNDTMPSVPMDAVLRMMPIRASLRSTTTSGYPTFALMTPPRLRSASVSQAKEYRQHRFQPPPGATELILVRHGESAAAVDGQSFDLVDGHGDPPLSPDGRDQAARVCARLGTERIDAIYVTTLRRTSETAAALAELLGLTPIVEPDLREVYLGEWEGGEFRKRVAEMDPIAVRMITEERWDVIPGGEPATDFTARVRGAVERIAAAHPDQRVAVFAHGGVIGEVFAQAAGSRPWAFNGSDNASISHLVVTPQRWVVRRFNDTSHLETALTTSAEAPT